MLRSHLGARIGNEPLDDLPREPRKRVVRSSARFCGFAVARFYGESGSPLFFEDVLQDRAIEG